MADNRIINFHVGSKSYWIRRDQNTIIISSIKQKYLKLLGTNSKTADFAKTIGVCWKSAYRRLNELKQLGLVSYQNGKWIKSQNKKKIVIR